MCIRDRFNIKRIPLSKRVVGDYPVPRFCYREIAAIVKETDIVFNQTIGPVGSAAILAAKRLNKPCISFTHNQEWELVPKAMGNNILRRLAYPVSKFVARYLYGRCTALIVPSEYTADELTFHRIYTTKRIVHLGIDSEKFVPGDKKKARKQLGLPEDAYIIGFHGRIAHEKNLLTLLRAFLRLRIPGKRLLIVGDGVPSLRKKLSKQRVIITGMQQDVVPWIQAMDLYVMPSLAETTCLSTLEAMSCGIPVIASEVGFMQHYIEDGRNGFHFPARDAYALFMRINHVRSVPSAELEFVREAARDTVVKRFTWESTAKNIRKALEEFGPVSKDVKK